MHQVASRDVTPITSTLVVWRRLRLILLLCVGAVCLTAVPTVSAQSLMQPPVTKEEARATPSPAPTAATGSAQQSGSGLVWGMIGIAALLMVGGGIYMLRDARFAAGGDREVVRRPIDSSSVRGAPQTMFRGDGEPGGKVGKRKKREQGKRQRQARRAARKR